MSPQPHITIETAGTISAAVIWLHGLGADGNDFAPIVPQLNLPDDLGVRFIFPHAAIRPVTINRGMKMRAWFDMTAISESAPIDYDGLKESSEQIKKLIRQQNEAGIPYEKIVLAGFSQGGALALHVALHYPQQFAGVLALSTYIPKGTDVTQSALPTNNSTSIFMAHGKSDMVVPYSLGQKSFDVLRGLGLKVEWHSYPMEHSVCPQEIQDIGQWLTNVLK